MPVPLKEIQLPIKHHIKEFEVRFRDAMRTNVSLLDRIMQYIIKRKGKQMRPMFVFLTAGTVNSINDKTYRGAALVELLHTATLIHDDVVDESYQRRGFFSINALWKNKIAVLVGDYLLSKGLLLSVDNKDYDLLEISSTAVKQMSEGELLQLEKSRGMNFDESVYFDIITKKTASLIASCCAMGAKSVSEEADKVQLMYDFGTYVGLAFQIKDDLFDYAEYDTGKPVGIDIKEKKLTLPIIYALNNTDKSTRKDIIKKIGQFKGKKEEIKYIFEFVKKFGGIAYAEQVMESYKKKAFEALNPFPESVYKTALIQLVDYTINRNI